MTDKFDWAMLSVINGREITDEEKLQIENAARDLLIEIRKNQHGWRYHMPQKIKLEEEQNG